MLQKICIVDDENEITDMCKDYLQSDYQVKIFDSAAKALEAFEAGYCPELIVSDLKMPKVSGLEFIKLIKNKNLKSKVIMMSGHAEKKHVIEAMDQKIIRFIEKPFDVSTLKKTIKETLDRPEIYLKMETLIHLREKQQKLFLAIINQYFHRVAFAENRAYESPKQFFNNPNELKEYLEQIREENSLTMDLQTCSDEIQVLTNEIDLSHSGSRH